MITAVSALLYLVLFLSVSLNGMPADRAAAAAELIMMNTDWVEHCWVTDPWPKNTTSQWEIHGFTEQIKYNINIYWLSVIAWNCFLVCIYTFTTQTSCIFFSEFAYPIIQTFDLIFY